MTEAHGFGAGQHQIEKTRGETSSEEIDRTNERGLDHPPETHLR